MSDPTPKQILAGFTGSFDQASNRLFMRQLHNPFFSELYSTEDSTLFYDSANRVTGYRRGKLKDTAPHDIPTSSPDNRMRLPGTNAERPMVCAG